jgi:hypothetical protein
MKKRNKQAAIGLSMLDLISNSLAAVIILFIIITSLRVPYIPPERVKGTLYARIELKGQGQPADLESLLWVEPPAGPDQISKRFFGTDIFHLNTDPLVFGPYSDCSQATAAARQKKGFITPCAMNYSSSDNPNIHHLVIRDPLKASWVIGVLSVDHTGFLLEDQPTTADCQVWFLDNMARDSFEITATPLSAPTSNKGWRIDLSAVAL